MKLIFYFRKHHQNVNIEIVYTSDPEISKSKLFTLLTTKMSKSKLFTLLTPKISKSKLFTLLTPKMSKSKLFTLLTPRMSKSKLFTLLTPMSKSKLFTLLAPWNLHVFQKCPPEAQLNHEHYIFSKTNKLNNDILVFLVSEV